MEKVQFVDIDSITPNPLKLRIYQSEPENYDFIKETISKYGIIEPLLVNKDTKVIMSGNIRHKIAKELGILGVPVIFRSVYVEEMDIQSLLTDVQRVKTYYEILKELQFFEEHFKVGQGSRTDINPELKKLKEERDEFNSGVSRDTRSKLKKIDEIAKVLYGENTPEYFGVFTSMDVGRTTLNGQYQALIDKRNRKGNESVVPKSYSIKRKNTKIFNKSAEDMSNIEDESIHAIITSPPYFQMREYGNENELGQEDNVEGYLVNLMKIFKECHRVLRDDGSLFVNINDCVVNNRYQAVPQRFLMKMIHSGWLFNDEMIWLKNNPTYTRGKRSVRSHEYIFHFVKTPDFYYDDSWLKELTDIDNEISYGTNNQNPKAISGMDFRGNVLRTNVSSTADLRKKCAKKGFYLTHSATFPIDVPSICGLLTTKEGDSILDCFAGTSVTGEFARRNKRKFFGYELNPQFVMASEVRLREGGLLYIPSYMSDSKWFINRDIESLVHDKPKLSRNRYSNFSEIFGSVIRVLEKYD